MAEVPESWLSGPIQGVPPHLMPVAHALVQAKRDLQTVASDLTVAEAWKRPGGAAAIGFHLQHIAGVLSRLRTYARGEELSDTQMQALRTEGEPGEPPAQPAALLRGACAAIDEALEQVRATPEDSLLVSRAVGRKKLPSNVLGVLYHAGEHVTRHTAQIITTFKFLRGAP